MNKTAAIYARVSANKFKDDGERRQDVTRQLELLTPIVKDWMRQQDGSQDWIAWQFVDDGISAAAISKKNRPAFQDLVSGIRTGDIGAVFVEDYTRFARDSIEAMLAWKLMQEKDITFYSQKDGGLIDLFDPNEKLSFRLKVVIAENSEDQRRLKVTQAMARKVKAAKDFLEKGIGEGKNICPECNELHMGRHPKTCGDLGKCVKCVKKRLESFNPAKN